MFLGTTVANFGSYLYHLLMGRMLGPRDYGILTSLISLVSIFSVFSGTFSTTLVKFTTRYKAKNNYHLVYRLFTRSSVLFLFFGSFVFYFFALAKDEISAFLNLEEPSLIFLVGVFMLINFLLLANESFLRAFLKFRFISLNSILNVSLKLLLGVILVKLGFSVFGAFGAFIIAYFVVYLLSFIPLRFLWQYKNSHKKISWKTIFLYGVPVLVSSLGLISLYSTDIILVKHFFSSYEAGLYGALSTLGRIVFFASSIIPTVMFPLVSESFERGKNYRLFFIQSFALVGVISSGVTVIYFLFPKLMIRLLYGSSYLSVSKYLGFFAIFMVFYSLSSLITNFFLSVRKVRVSLLPFSAALAQIFLIWFFHQNLFQVIKVSILVSALLFFSLLIYYFQNEKA